MVDIMDAVSAIVNPLCVLLAAVCGCVTTCCVAKQEMARRLKLKKFEAIEGAIRQLSCRSHVYLNCIALLEGEVGRGNILMMIVSFSALMLRLNEIEAHDSDAMIINLYIADKLPKNDLQSAIKAREALILAFAKAKTSLENRIPLSDIEFDDIKQEIEAATNAFKRERDYIEDLIEKLRQELKRAGLAAELFKS